MGQRDAVNHDGTFPIGQQPGNTIENRRFAGTGLPHQPEALPSVYLKRYILNRLIAVFPVAEHDIEIIYL